MTAPCPLPGFRLVPAYLDRPGQEALLAALRTVLASAPLYAPRMPKSGKPLSVRMTNCGPLGRVTDEAGYRYQPLHPLTGRPWPALPRIVLEAWKALAGYPHAPESCLVNYYGPAARMGLHQDRDERAFEAPGVCSRSAIPACFGSEGRSATIPPAPSGSPPATPWSWAARRGLPFTASTASFPARRACYRKADGSISRSGG